MLGIAVINECVKNKINVTAVAHPGSVKINRLPVSEFVNVVECGLEETEKLASLLKGEYDAFYHFGWTDTDKNGRNDAIKQARNIDYTLQAVNVAAKMGCKIFLGAGSQAEYGRVTGSISPDTKAAPEVAYGAAKYAAGKLSAILCGKLGIKNVWTRIFSVYGPNDSPGTMIMYCIDRLLKNEKPALTKCGQMWDYLYCSDAARALLLAGEKGRDMAVYNIGGGTARPLKEYVEILRDSINPLLEVGIGSVEYAQNQVMSLCADISSLTHDTGFLPQVQFSSGIKETIKWQMENTK
jgi:nucleoside-diphosphate-sugar epimerase